MSDQAPARMSAQRIDESVAESGGPCASSLCPEEIFVALKSMQRREEDLASMMKLMIRRLRRNGYDDLAERALHLLQRHGLLGSPLRDGPLGDQAEGRALAVHIGPREEGLVLAAARWIDIVRASRDNPGWMPSRADVHKSALFARLRAGKEPLAEAPPLRFAYPWYDLIEQADRAHRVIEFVPAPCPSGSTAPQHKCVVDQTFYDDCGCVQDAEHGTTHLLGYGPWRFKVWSEMSRSSSDDVEKSCTWWIQRDVAREPVPSEADS